MTTGRTRAVIGGTGLGVTCFWSSVSNPPLALALPIVVLSFALAGLNLLMPQESTDRRQLWQEFLRFLDERHRRAHERRNEGARKRTTSPAPPTVRPAERGRPKTGTGNTTRAN